VSGSRWSVIKYRNAPIKKGSRINEQLGILNFYLNFFKEHTGAGYVLLI
jgi:hypothetical protein